MEIDLTTPALLFPAVSLLMLAYTNRFLALAALIRELHTAFRETGDLTLRLQITNLRRRVLLIRNMQAAGVLSLFSCVLCMFLLFAGELRPARAVFALSLVLLMLSLALSIWEVQISVGALKLHLGEVENSSPPPR